MENSIKPIKPSIFKRVMRFLFYKQFVLFVIMYEYKVNRSQAKKVYKLWSEVKNYQND